MLMTQRSSSTKSAHLLHIIANQSHSGSNSTSSLLRIFIRFPQYRRCAFIPTLKVGAYYYVSIHISMAIGQLWSFGQDYVGGCRATGRYWLMGGG